MAERSEPVRYVTQRITGEGKRWVARVEDPGLEETSWRLFQAFVAYVNELEEAKHNLETELLKERELRISLQEDVRQFNTFEQICNSGMLRNFKIDSEGDFGRTILGLLQKTMELQIDHLMPNHHPKSA